MVGDLGEGNDLPSVAPIGIGKVEVESSDKRELALCLWAGLDSWRAHSVRIAERMASDLPSTMHRMDGWKFRSMNILRGFRSS